MKNLTVILITGIIFVYCIGAAQAAPILFPTHTVDFSGGGTESDGRTWIDIGGDTTPFTYTYSHVLPAWSPAAASIATASLSLTHNNNSNGTGEMWFSYSGGDIYIGLLSYSGGTAWITDTWALSSDILTEIMSSNPWALNVKLVETTSATDMLKLDKSELNGTYNPGADPAVPEPASFLLFALGGLATAIIKRKSR